MANWQTSVTVFVFISRDIKSPDAQTNGKDFLNHPRLKDIAIMIISFCLLYYEYIMQYALFKRINCGLERFTY